MNHARRKANCSWAKGFSLIELLVVVSIIALLTSLLLPALGQAKKKVYEIQCVNNLKQLGTVSFLYINDYGGLPPYWNAATNMPWEQVFMDAGYLRWSVSGSNKVHTDGRWMYCPSWTPPGMLNSQGAPEVRSSIYGINVERAPVNGELAMVSKIRNPSATDVYADTIQIGSGYQSYIYYCSPCNWKIHLRHARRANFWFFDGHVNSFNQNELTQWPGFPSLYTNTYY